MKRHNNTQQKTPTFQIEEIGGDQFPSLEAAQRAALPGMAESLQAIIRDLLEQGVLIKNSEGKIIPNPRSKQ